MVLRFPKKIQGTWESKKNMSELKKETQGLHWKKRTSHYHLWKKRIIPKLK